jgi:radical SAM protein with 4Fe4S-binding SPASM domain
MANLVLTTACNRACDYCFAPRGGQAQYMSRETFVAALGFVERSGMDHVRFLGGEPTLHPEFGDFLDCVLRRGKRALVFTGGVIPGRSLEALARAPAERLTVLLNFALPGSVPAEVSRRQHEVMDRLGPRVRLGINFQSPADDPHPLLPLIDEYGLDRRLRAGLAHPGGGQIANRSLHPRQYKAAGAVLSGFLRAAENAGVSVEFDCGFCLCMFPESEMESILSRDPKIGLRCGPVLDVMPSGNAIHCFPLAGWGETPLGDRTRPELAARHETFRDAGVFKDCAACQWRQAGRCAGGCLAAALTRARTVLPPGSAFFPVAQ